MRGAAGAGIETRIVLWALSVTTVLSYHLGDVVRMFADDFDWGQIALGCEPRQAMWRPIRAIKLVSIGMVVLNETLEYPPIRWVNIGAAGLLAPFNTLSLPHRGALGNFPIVVSCAFSALTIWYAREWI